MTWRCGHERTWVNTVIRDGSEKCAICRREIERKASKRYRERRAA